MLLKVRMVQVAKAEQKFKASLARGPPLVR